MPMSNYSRTKILVILCYALASAAIGVAFALILKRFVFPHDGDSALKYAALGGLTGGIICATFTTISSAIERLFTKPLWVVLVAMPVIYSSIIAVEYGAVFCLIMGPEGLLSESLLITMGFSLLMSLVISFLGMVSRLLGHNVLSRFIFGKYHRPVIEERFVMYLDIAGSTGLAERLGNVAFLSFLNDFFCDISRPVIDCKGDIHKYLGDGVIITWNKRDGIDKASAARAFFDIADGISSVAARYEARYGTVPGFRAGLHYGAVAVGEMGDMKREIAIIGDVMNTASRIQAECRPLGTDFLVSKEALALLEPLMRGLSASFCGDAALRGKEATTALYSVRRDAAD